MTPIQTAEFTERHLIESVLRSFYIIDYGYVTKVNGDDTVKVTHAVRQTTETGEELAGTETDNIEVLTFSTGEIAIKVKPKAGDKVLLCGLRDFVKKTEDVTKALSQEFPSHYDRSTLKALPLAAFDSAAKMTIEIEDGKATIKASEVIIEASKLTVKNNGMSMLEVG